MIAAGSRVRLTKVSHQNSSSPPEPYWLEGRLVEPPTVGHTLQVERTAHSIRREDKIEGIKAAGWYVSSPVRKLLENPDGTIVVNTLHLCWEISALPDSP